MSDELIMNEENNYVKEIPDKNILLFKSCLVSVEYPGIESSTTFVFDKIGVDYFVSDKQTCCTGLGHYSDVFDQFTTTVIGARNFSLAKNMYRPNIVMLCATCYAINKKVANILNNNEDIRNKVNNVFDESDLNNLKFEKGDLNSSDNIFHVVDILYNKQEEISRNIKYDLSKYKIATHHGCHYCKVHYDDTIGGVRNPMILDDLISACGCETIGWYDHKRTTCGSGFRQRYANKKLSMDVTKDKLMSLNKDDVDILVHLCPNCHVQFDRYQNLISKESGENFKTIHLNIAQFIAIVMGADWNKVVGTQTHSIPIESIIDINSLEEVNFKDKFND
ncbi:MAG: CoB--CoM heterodisulfide reductase iron-sulfur subunit B family protein [archaeon]|nr:CoB--CoM heterodisulfide reductase iron-sulfur subunit B family protein [archaeon]